MSTINNTDSEYFRLVNKILAEGEWKGNRTGVDCLTVARFMFEHDMSEGFPLLTSRKLPFKSTKVELEFFIKGLTDKKWLQDRKCGFWNDWCNPQKVSYGHDEDTKRKMRDERDLGKVYGYQWVNWDSGKELVEIPIKISEFQTIGVLPLPNSPELTPKEQDNPFYNEVLSSQECGDFKVIRFDGRDEDSHKRFTIQFVKTKYVKSNIRICQIKSGSVFDPFSPSICKIAAAGLEELPEDEFEQLTYKSWYDMINRCYNSKCTQYKFYGERGIKVADKWLLYVNYRKDIEKLPRFQDYIINPKKYSLDKDYYGSTVYAPDVCVFLEDRENKLYNSSLPIEVYNDEKKYIFLNKTQVGEFLGFTRKNTDTYLDKNKSYKGWFVKSKDLNGGNLRYPLPINQVKRIVDTLKTNPNDRRMIVTAWNNSQLHEMALVPCHYSWQVTVIGDKLNLAWNQRSVDVCCGLPQNIASYATLLHLLAKESGLKEGKLIGFLMDTHIYANHIDGIKKQLEQETFKLPQIKTRNFTSIFNWQYSDTELLNYICSEPIKYEVAV